MSDQQKLSAVKDYLSKTKKAIDKAIEADSEYDTSDGQGVNCFEANLLFRDVDKQIRAILK